MTYCLRPHLAGEPHHAASWRLLPGQCHNAARAVISVEVAAVTPGPFRERQIFETAIGVPLCSTCAATVLRTVGHSQTAIRSEIAKSLAATGSWGSPAFGIFLLPEAA